MSHMSNIRKDWIMCRKSNKYRTPILGLKIKIHCFAIAQRECLCPVRPVVVPDFCELKTPRGPRKRKPRKLHPWDVSCPKGKNAHGDEPLNDGPTFEQWEEMQ